MLIVPEPSLMLLLLCRCQCSSCGCRRTALDMAAVERPSAKSAANSTVDSNGTCRKRLIFGLLLQSGRVLRPWRARQEGRIIHVRRRPLQQPHGKAACRGLTQLQSRPVPTSLICQNNFSRKELSKMLLCAWCRRQTIATVSVATCSQ